MAKVGRNDPCPCGSGKKYKFCCGDRKIIPFPNPYADEAAQDHDIPADPTDLPSIGELKVVFDELMERESNTPVDDFLGLSSATMHEILYAKFEDNAHIVAFTPEIGEKDVNAVPLMKQALYFLTALREVQPLKGTQRGNLPRGFVQQLYENVVKEYLLYDDMYPQKEGDIMEIEKLRYILTFAGLIKKAKLVFSLTRAAEQLLDKFDLTGIYRRIFQGISFKFAWNSEDGYADYRIIQDALIFDLYVLHKLAKRSISSRQLGEAFVRAFPLTASESGLHSDPVDQVIHCFSIRFIRRFAVPMGLLVPEPSATNMERIMSDSVKYKVTPLFRRIFKWNIEH